MGDDNLIASFMSAFGFDKGFYLTEFLGNMFGTSNVNGEDSLHSFEISGENSLGESESFWLITGGRFGNEWAIQ
jgi:hypothetical protein